MRFVLLALLTTHGLVACGGDDSGDGDSFNTFQACYDEHHGEEGLTASTAITICCIDHPIGGAAANTVCGETAAACTTYVTANVTDAADTMLQADISTACTDYIVDREG